MKILFKILSIFFFLCIIIIPLKSENYHRHSYSLYEMHEGGQILCSASSGLCFFIQNNWADDNVTIYSWKGIERHDANGRVFNSTRIIASALANKKLYILSKYDNTYFFEEISSSLKTEQRFEIDNSPNVINDHARFYLNDRSDIIYFLNNNSLYQYNLKQEYPPVLLSGSVEGIAINNAEPDKKAFLVRRRDLGFINIIDSNGLRSSFSRVQLSENTRIFWPDSTIFIISGLSRYSNSLVIPINPRNSSVGKSFWVESRFDLIKCSSINGYQFITYLKHNGQFYSLNINQINSAGLIKKENVIKLPPELVEPLGLRIDGESIYALFSNGLVTFDYEGTITSLDYFPFIEYSQTKPDFSFFDKYLILSSDNNSIILEKKSNNLWAINKIIHQSGKILLPVLFIVIIILVIQLYRHQKRLLNEVLALPTAGALIVIDKSGRLVKLNTLARDLLGITENIPLRKPFEFYFARDRLKPVMKLIEKSYYNRTKVVQKVSITEGNDVKEWYCSLIIMRNITGNFRGVVFTGIDITEQIERKRLSNWAQLAHDMQTSLSTIRLNAEQLEISNEINHSRRDKIIHQVNVLIQRVRDIVTVGRSDELNVNEAYSSDICLEARNEFDEVVFPGVEFEVDAENFTVYCDRQKLIRALRNAIENGIRSLKNKTGKIIIRARKDNKYAMFTIIDNGKGMDEKIRKKVLTPYFTTSRKEGGAGIGTMIMQHVTDMHGGRIIIDSEKNKGTSVTFRIPNLPPMKRTSDSDEND